MLIFYNKKPAIISLIEISNEYSPILKNKLINF
jgi:hypothetical protein